MKRFLRVLLWTLGTILLVWLALTLWVQQSRTAVSSRTELKTERGSALILFNPDPIYNLDAQLARGFSKGLEKAGWASEVSTYETLPDSEPPPHDLYVIIANTYNWAPDWPTRHFIERSSWLEGEAVVALTLGSGATTRSQRLLEELLQERRVDLIASRTYWLIRPNDDSRPQEPNVKVARDFVLEWATMLGKELDETGDNTSQE